MLAMLSLKPLLTHETPRWWFLVGGISMLVLSLTVPRLLAPMVAVLSRVGHLAGSLLAWLTLSGMFYLVVVPMGWAMRAFGYDPLRRRWEPDASSYWIKRQPDLAASKTMTQQF